MNLSSRKLIIILSELILINIFIITNLLINQKTKSSEVLIASQTKISQPRIGFGEILAKALPDNNTQVLAAIAFPTPVPMILMPSKNEYTIAIYGDSMVETMGDNLDYLQKELKEKYPYTKFKMYNYGIGAEKVTEGLNRFPNSFDRGNRHYPSIYYLNPDILIIGSYAYNPFDQHDSIRHKNSLAELVNSVRQISKVYLLAEIAPVETGFGTGPGGVNWPLDIAKLHVQRIQEQMQNVFSIKTQLTVPVIDVYNLSKQSGTNYGNPDYVSTHDHIHPSILGQKLTAGKIVETIEIQ